MNAHDSYHDSYIEAIKNWNALSSQGTITGEFLAVFNQLGEIANSLSKLLGLIK